MPAKIKCLSCGRVTTARILEDDYTTNALTLEDDINWKDEDFDEPVTCIHEEYKILEINYDDGPP